MASMTNEIHFEQFVPGLVDDPVLGFGVLDAAGEPAPAP